MTRATAKYVLFVLGSSLVAVAGFRFTHVGDLFGTTLFDIVVKDYMNYGSTWLLISTLALAALGAAIIVFAAGMRRPGHVALDRSMARTDLVRALLVLGSTMAALVVVLFAVVPGDLGSTLLDCVANGSPCYASSTVVVSTLVLSATGASILVIGAQMRRSRQAASSPAMTRTEVERALLMLGSVFVALAVVLFTLVPDGLDSTLVDSWVAGSNSSYGFINTFLRDSAISLAALGTALLACGAGITWHERSVTRTDVERALLVLGSALAALAVLRLAVVRDVIGPAVLEAAFSGFTGSTPTFPRDSTIIVAAVGVGIIVIGAAMSADSHRERRIDRSERAVDLPSSVDVRPAVRPEAPE